FCLPVPRVSEAKTLATATFILGIVNTLMPIITCVIAYVVIGAAVLAFLSERSSGALAGAGIVVLVLSILTIVLVISEVIAFLQFLRMITLHLGAVGLAKSISYLLLLGLVILVLALLM